MDSDGRNGKWITKLQEYDMEIKPTKLVKGQWLVRLLTEANYVALEMCTDGFICTTLIQESVHEPSPLEEVSTQETYEKSLGKFQVS